MKTIILASGSPRRHELLELLQIKHKVIPCKEEEKKLDNNLKTNEIITKSLEQDLLEVSYQKVQCVLKNLPKELSKDAIIIGADTIVVLDGEIIGKPKDREDAVLMLQTLLGKTHIVFTGLTVLDLNTNKILTAVEKTKVSMVDWTIHQIKNYLEKENVLDKAGAYAIQGLGAAMIDRIEGCFYNVMGLPLYRLISMLAKINFEFP